MRYFTRYLPIWKISRIIRPYIGNEYKSSRFQLIPVGLTSSPKPNYGGIQITINFLIQKKTKETLVPKTFKFRISELDGWDGIARRSRSGEEEWINAVRSGSSLYRDDLTMIKNLYSKEDIALKHRPIVERNLFWKLILLSKKNQTFSPWTLYFKITW